MTAYLIDGRPLQDQSSLRGIGTYVRGLLEGLVSVGSGPELSLLLAAGDQPPPEAGALGLDVAPVRLAALRRRLQPLADPFLVAAALRRLRPRLYHAVEYAQPLVSRVPVVITVHDLVPFRFPEQYPWMRRERLLALRLIRRADAVIAVSKATAGDLVRFARVPRERITVIPHGVGPQFSPAPPDAVAALRAHHGITRPYLLGVGTFDPRKRIDLLAAVAARVVPDHDADLVIIGAQGAYGPSTEAALAHPALAGRVHQLGHLPAEDLPALYSGAECLLFTSGYEGFGLPPLEAMACGTPVALFDNSSLPEVAGDAALLIADGDAGAMTRAVSGLLGNPAAAATLSERARAHAATFTWAATAERTLAVYREVLARR